MDRHWLDQRRRQWCVHRVLAQLATVSFPGWLGRNLLAKGIRRPRCNLDGTSHLSSGVSEGQHTTVNWHHRTLARWTNHHRHGYAGTEIPLLAHDSFRGRDLVPGVFRTKLW